MARSVVVNFIGDAAKLTGTISKVEGKMAGLKKAGRFLGPPLLVAGTAIAAELVHATKGFQDHQKVVKETETRIKEMGNAAGVTADHVGSLSDRIEAQTSVDGDLVQGGANMLLTFSNIRNEVGKGKDVFDQATLAATNMAAKFGGDASSQAIVLGKALDNPTKGLSALTRIGVSFSKQEQQQIKDMQEHGNIAGAQALILKAVNKQVGGAAEAQATSWSRLQVKLHGIEDNIGAFLLPILDKVTTFITNKVIPALERWWKDHGRQVIGSVQNFGHALENLRHSLGNAGHAIGNGIHALDNFLHALGNTLHALQNFLHAVDNVQRAISGSVSAVVRFANSIPGKIKSAVGDTSKLLLQAGKNVVQGLVDGIRSKASAVGNAIGGIVGKIKGFFPNSPEAKEGPLSGQGSPFRLGANVARMIAEGLTSGNSGIGRGMTSLLTPVAASARGGHTFNNTFNTNASAQDIAREIAWQSRFSGR